MFRIPARVSMTALTLAAALTLGACAGDNRSAVSGSPAPAATSTPADSPSISRTPPDAANDADVLFAQMTIPHQKQAIEMSDMILAKHGVDPRIGEIATTIKQERTTENNQMSGWLTGWGASATPSMDMRHDRVGNMVAQADVDKLKQATGTQSAALFLDDMIEHHESAIGIAQAEVDDGQNPDAHQFAQQLIANQKSEIKALTRLRSSI